MKNIKEISSKCLNVLGVTLGIVLIANTLWILFTGFDPSKFFSAFFGASLLIYLALIKWLKKRASKMEKVLKVLFVLFLISLVIIEGLLLSAAKREAKSGDVVIVLGAGLSGRNPGPLLSLRLNKAVAFLQDNPSAVCVVSGGQGADEIVSEAEAMANYLLGKGIAAESIIKEDQSTDTVENFRNSKILLDEYFQGKKYTGIYITSDFHVYRSGLIAQAAGLDFQGIAAPSLPSSRVNYYLREYCAFIFHFLFKQ